MLKLSLILNCKIPNSFLYLSLPSLMDLSKSSLNEAKKTSVTNNKIQKIILKHDDIIKNIDKHNFDNYEIVTGSAFLDIMPVDWFKKFYTKKIQDFFVTRHSWVWKNRNLF